MAKAALNDSNESWFNYFELVKFDLQISQIDLQRLFHAAILLNHPDKFGDTAKFDDDTRIKQIDTTKSFNVGREMFCAKDFTKLNA